MGLGRLDDAMALCGLRQKGLREQFVAKSEDGEYIRCSNRACGYFRWTSYRLTIGWCSWTWPARLPEAMRRSVSTTDPAP